LTAMGAASASLLATGVAWERPQPPTLAAALGSAIESAQAQARSVFAFFICCSIGRSMIFCRQGQMVGVGM
jgi:hypothetical protein